MYHIQSFYVLSFSPWLFKKTVRVIKTFLVAYQKHSHNKFSGKIPWIKTVHELLH